MERIRNLSNFGMLDKQQTANEQVFPKFKALTIQNI